MPTGRRVKNYTPTPDQIAEEAAKIREEWSERRWELQRTARERHWMPMQAKDPDLSCCPRHHPHTDRRSRGPRTRPTTCGSVHRIAAMTQAGDAGGSGTS